MHSPLASFFYSYTQLELRMQFYNLDFIYSIVNSFVAEERFDKLTHFSFDFVSIAAALI